MQDTDPVKARLAATQTIRQRMTALGREQLSRQTGLPIATLEALEQGGSQPLPEDRNMGPKLEALAEILGLPIWTVESAAGRPPAGQGNSIGRRLGQLRKAAAALGPPQIDLDSGWGRVIYGLLVAVLLYGLNLQQRQLAADNLLSLEPIAPLPLDIHLSDTPVRLAEQEQVEAVNPAVEFQPLARLEDSAIRRQLLREALQPADQPPEHGLLEIALAAPAQVTVLQQGVVHGQIKGESGVMRWRLRPAFSLTVVPARSAVVRWNNEPLDLADEARGLFLVDAP